MAGSELTSYRRRGGYAGLSQLLRVHDDGRVELHDRKTRKRTEVQATDAEIATLRSLIDAVPAERWHSLGGAIARRMLPSPHEAMRFEVRCRAAAGSAVPPAQPRPTSRRSWPSSTSCSRRAVREGRAPLAWF